MTERSRIHADDDDVLAAAQREAEARPVPPEVRRDVLAAMQRTLEPIRRRRRERKEREAREL